MIKNKKFFITGGAGFIGTNLISKIIKDNEITVYDNLSRDALKKSEFANHPNLKILAGDILDFNNLKKSISSTLHQTTSTIYKKHKYKFSVG